MKRIVDPAATALEELRFLEELGFAREPVRDGVVYRRGERAVRASFGGDGSLDLLLIEGDPGVFVYDPERCRHVDSVAELREALR